MNIPTRSVLAHFRRYPTWYALAVVWAVAMALVPVVRNPVAQLADRSRPRPIAGRVAAAPAPPAPIAPVDIAPAPTASPSLPGVPALPPSAPAPTGSPPVDPPTEPPGLILIPPPPALPLPEFPEQLTPVFNALSPLMSTGCSGIGLAAVVIAVAAPTVEDVPLDQLLPYLVPAYTVCALFPIPKSRTVCELDDMFAATLPAELTSLFPAPTIMGLGIDEIAGIEYVVSQTTGSPPLGLADSLRTQLGCRSVS